MLLMMSEETKPNQTKPKQETAINDELLYMKRLSVDQSK